MTVATMKESRSSPNMECLQEVIDASVSAKHATLGYNQQYETPVEFAALFNSLLPQNPRIAFDPQCASGNTITVGFPHWVRKFGFEIDRRFEDKADGVTRAIGNCVTCWEIMDDLFPDLKLECQNSNPPFGCIWPTPDGGKADSTEYTWRKIMQRTHEHGYGWFISNHKTIERLGIDRHPFVYLYQKFPVGVWKNCDVEIGVVHWDAHPKRAQKVGPLVYNTLDLTEHKAIVAGIKKYYYEAYQYSHPNYIERETPGGDLPSAIEYIGDVIREEKGKRPPFNIFLDGDGMLKTYLSTRFQLKRKLSRDEILRIATVNDQHPLTLTTDRESRKLMADLVNCGIYTIQPEALKAIQDALAEVSRLSAPLLPVSDFETVAWADEEDHLDCISDYWVGSQRIFTKGKAYELTTASYTFTENFKRNKPHYKEPEREGERGEMYTVEHHCSLTGSDRYVAIEDDEGNTHRFMDKPQHPEHGDHEEALLWKIFAKPVVKTVAETHPELVAKNELTLATCELLANFSFYPGQLGYLARVGVKDYGIIAAGTGCHRIGTPIMMSDGTTKAVEHIVPGDPVMGWTGKPARVIKLARGRGKMYEIKPVKGKSFVVNEDHILTLVHTSTGEIIDVSVRDWLQWNRQMKHLHKLFRLGVSLPSQPAPMDPYLMGVLLGDGSFVSGYRYSGLGVTIGNANPEIKGYIRDAVSKHGWKLRTVNKNGSQDLWFSMAPDLRQAVDLCGLRGVGSGDKFVPDAFKFNDRYIQSKVIAGLMDTDGHWKAGGGYEFVTKSSRLSDDVVFMCRCLGLAAYVSPCIKGCQTGAFGTYYRVSISGECSTIPCLVKRKQAPIRRQIKSVLRTGFSAVELGEEDYYGFTLAGDGRFLMGDFTVTHNCGKSLMAISLIQMKGPKRALIIAPQGTMRASSSDEDEEEESEQQASQWVSELRRFAPGLPVFQLFSMEDYRRILKANDGVAPEGVYVSYYEAMFSNGARETAADSWNDERLEQECQNILGTKSVKLPENPPHVTFDPARSWCATVGREGVDGIRCIMMPCMATQIGHLFDMVCLDEGHKCANLSANVSQMLIRMQAKYRFVFTATPIPNVVGNLFSLMGWICVPDWYKGERRNAAWPYARNELARFTDTFQSQEEDHTQEQMNDAQAKGDRHRRRRSRVIKVSPVISSPARLLKILKPNMAYISKFDCNPNYTEAKVVDVRVDFGAQQAILYEHFMDRGNIDAKNPLVRARKQITYLRNICADPHGFTHGGPSVRSNFNPKTIGMLELVRDITNKGDPVTVVCARKGQTNTLHTALRDAGILVSRIDSTIPAEQHSHQSNLFKDGKTQVHLMGIKCAVAHSYSECPYMVIGSLEYSWGSLDQARGRIDRVNSKYARTIYCVLHRNSIEEVMFSCVATKQDAATICLRGMRVPREYKPVDMSEVLAEALDKFKISDAEDESQCEAQWPKLRLTFNSAK